MTAAQLCVAGRHTPGSQYFQLPEHYTVQDTAHGNILVSHQLLEVSMIIMTDIQIVAAPSQPLLPFAVLVAIVDGGQTDGHHVGQDTRVWTRAHLTVYTVMQKPSVITQQIVLSL